MTSSRTTDKRVVYAPLEDRVALEVCQMILIQLEHHLPYRRVDESSGTLKIQNQSS